MCCAPLISDGPIIFLVLVILTQLPAVFLRALQIVGGLFLLYLAKEAFVAPTSSASSARPPRSFVDAVLMNFLSPGPYIFWSTITGPMFLKAWRIAPINGLSILFGFYTMLIGGFVGFVLLAGASMQLDSRAAHLLHRIAAVTLAVFGLWQIWAGTMRF